MEPPDDLPSSDYLSKPSNSSSTTTSSTSSNLKQSTLNLLADNSSSYLSELNPSQLEAVEAPLEGGTQLLAGPGAGKTKVLTCRISQLIQTKGLEPDKIVVVTFTNKAANEMKFRLEKILGNEIVEKVVMGTFHSVCVRYLRKYSKLVNLSSTFTIADRDDCITVIKRVLSTTLSETIPDQLKKENFKPRVYLEEISKCKARRISPLELSTSRKGEWDEIKFEWISKVYQAYDDELEKSNCLDFDDLLLKGHELFSNHPRVVSKIQSVLIDEFQDTNSVQYDLVKLIAKSSNSLTIVGDPDQSIYGWRNAEVENLEKMEKDFKPCRQIFLEQNYRSTGAILGAALAVVRQDTKRINKSLHSSHPSGSSIVLHSSSDPQSEANFIASTIRHLIAHLGGLVSYKDFSILLRYGALSRSIEVGLQKTGIPNKMVGGHKFFERSEVKDLLSYLQLFSNENYSPALERVLNVPKRGLGEKAQKMIFETSSTSNLTPFQVCEKFVRSGGGGIDGSSSLGTAQKKSLKEFVEIIKQGQKKAKQERIQVSELIDFVLERTRYRAYLEKTNPGSTEVNERWENVEELKNFAVLVQNENPVNIVGDGGGVEGEGEIGTEDNEVEVEVEMEEVEIEGESGKREQEEKEFGQEELKALVSRLALFFLMTLKLILSSLSTPMTKSTTKTRRTLTITEEDASTPLEIFLSTSMLATDTETQSTKSSSSSSNNNDKVTISTCHAAKGLEFGIVFIPACEQGTYPFFKCEKPEEIDEERRLLYVAITRAQSFCFISHSNSRMAAGQFQSKTLSPFLSTVSQTYPTLFVPKLSKITKKTREEMAKVLGRPPPDEEEAKRRISLLAAEAVTIPEPVAPSSQNSRYSYSSSGGFNAKATGGGFSNNGKWSSTAPTSSQSQPIPVGVSGGFQSARGMMGQNNNFGLFNKAGGGGGGTTVRTALPTSSSSNTTSKPTAFKPLRPVSNPSSSSSSSRPEPEPFIPPKYLAPRPQPNGISSLLPINSKKESVNPKKKEEDGPPEIVETRSSMIQQAVLVNPKLEKPKFNPSTQRDLLNSFQSNEQKLLNELKGLGGEGSSNSNSASGKGKGREEIDLTLSSDDPLLPTGQNVGGFKRPPMSPKRPAKKTKK
ncbi:hypothetical protein JCM3765_001218 [Sporobolomyces pararoseus]